MLNGFDIGNDLANANDEGFYDGYRSALWEIENQIDKLSKASWYSKGSIKKIITDELERFEVDKTINKE